MMWDCMRKQKTRVFIGTVEREIKRAREREIERVRQALPAESC